MIDIDNWMRELEEEEDIEIKNNEEYQTKLFEEYVPWVRPSGGKKKTE